MDDRDAAIGPVETLGPTLPGTAPLETAGDLATAMVAGISRYLDGELARMAEEASPSDWDDGAVAQHRTDLAHRIGVVDLRLPVPALELVGSTIAPADIGGSPRWTAWAVRWPVFPGVEGEGLWLTPRAAPRAHVIVLPDADQHPEQLAGLSAGIEPSCQVARLLADAGCAVLVPVLVDRGPAWPGGHPRREYVWRMAFEVGRHIIGYEVQRVLALVDHLAGPAGGGRPVAVYGYGEGGLIALHAAALDPRIGAAVISGHFRDRAQLWREPVYRDVWGLLRAGLDDAGLAALVAPRPLLIEAVPGPLVLGPSSGEPHPGDIRSAGSLVPAPPEAVRLEVERARGAFRRWGVADRLRLLEGSGPSTLAGPGAAGGVAALLETLGIGPSERAPEVPVRRSPGPDPDDRALRQFRQLCAHAQAVLRESRLARNRLWADLDRTSPEAWERACVPLRARFASELIGELPAPSAPPHPRSRPYADAPGWRGWEVTLDLWPGVFAQGLLLLPRDLRVGERRPVVVCQHGLEGRAQDTVVGPPESPYRAFAARLADLGYVVYAPQNPYLGDEAFRVLQRKAHPLQASLFSVIVAQHRRTVAWLRELPWVDPERIAFYGLSYGGKTAMRVPPLVPGYCLSICSADFNEWAMKCASEEAEHRSLGYLFNQEYDMYEFDVAHTFNYAEMAGLIAPRPFMVERGHRDGVGIDEWVAFEYARVRRLYAELGIGDRTELGVFNGGHWIESTATFAFLERHLGRPRAGEGTGKRGVG